MVRPGAPLLLCVGRNAAGCCPPNLMAKKHIAPVFSVAPAQEKESRWQCATCRGYLAFSLPIDVKTMGQMLQTFSKAHARCASQQQDTAAAPEPTPTPSPATPAAAAAAPAYDPNGPTAAAWARREELLALPRPHTPAEGRELSALVQHLTAAGVLGTSTTF